MWNHNNLLSYFGELAFGLPNFPACGQRVLVLPVSETATTREEFQFNWSESGERIHEKTPDWVSSGHRTNKEFYF